jgi:Secretion system C-terminal sorting domain
MKKILFAVLWFTKSIYTFAQAPEQLLFISGKDASAPALFIQAGQTGFVYVQGGITANNSSTPASFGTGVGTGTGKVVVNGALFIGSFGATPGSIVNATDARFEFDYTLGGTASATALSGTLPTLTGAVDGVNRRGGTVHLMGGTQKITGLNTNTTDEIAFYNLSLEGTNQDKNVEDVNIETGVAAAASSTGTLFLHNNYLHTNGNIVWVRNRNATQTGTIPTSGLAITRNAAGSGANSVGMSSLVQYETTSNGMITSTGQGRLRRSVVSGAGNTYLFPIGSPDKSLYRPLEIIAPISTTTYYAKINTPNSYPTMAGTPAPREVVRTFFETINADDAVSSPQFRIYSSETELAGAGLISCTLSQLLQDIGLAQSETTGDRNWGYQNGLAAAPGSGYLGYVTSVSYPSTGPLICGTGTRVTYRNWTGLTGGAQNEQGYVIASKPLPCIVNITCTPLSIPALLNLSGVLLNNKAQLHWVANNETAIHRFDVQKSSDGSNFTTIQHTYTNTISIPTKDYFNTDYLFANDTKKNIFYRIKQTNELGIAKYSNTIKLGLDKTNAITIFPNPFTKYIKVNSASRESKTIQILDATGKVLFTNTYNQTQITISNLEFLTKGIYTIVVMDGKSFTTEKLLKE